MQRTLQSLVMHPSRQQSDYIHRQYDSDGKEFACNAGSRGSTLRLGRSLEKGMATHSSILAWKIPWTEEPGGLQPMGLQRVGHD